MGKPTTFPFLFIKIYNSGPQSGDVEEEAGSWKVIVSTSV